MTKKRMLELADFFFSSNDSKDVPLRIAVISGQYSGHDLGHADFMRLMMILNSSKNLKESLLAFREALDE